jgi:DNA-binding MarR family transcriptional regulator
MQYITFMSTSHDGRLPRDVGFDDESLSADAATRVRIYRLVILLAQHLRYLMDARLSEDGLTTQQAALLTIVGLIGAPSFSDAAAELVTSHQNVKQLAAALERKGFVQIVPDEHDGRVRRIQMTAKCRSYWNRRNPSDYDAVLEWFSPLTPGQASELFEHLLRVTNHVDALSRAAKEL